MDVDHRTHKDCWSLVVCKHVQEILRDDTLVRSLSEIYVLEVTSGKRKITHSSNYSVAHKYHKVSNKYVSDVFLWFSSSLNDWKTALVDEVASAEHTCQVAKVGVEQEDVL